MLQQAQASASLPGPQAEEGCTSDESVGLPLSSTEYRVPSTGARITLSSAKGALFQFCQKLPSDRSGPLLIPAHLFSPASGSPVRFSYPCGR